MCDEIEIKKNELSVLEDKIMHTKIQLFRLRTILVADEPTVVEEDKNQLYDCHKDDKASLYSDNGNKSWVEFEKQFVETYDEPAQQSIIDYDWSVETASDILTDQTTESTDISRFYTRRQIIIGNTTQYLRKGVRVTGNRATHKWMIYVRSGPNEPPLQSFIESVSFFLHPSYSPHDIIVLGRPPFQITRLGWGEFPVRVQLHFKDRIHKPVDILHHLKLDNTRTGQQMLGDETCVDIDLIKGDQQQCDSIMISDYNWANEKISDESYVEKNVICKKIEAHNIEIWQILQGIAKRLPLYGHHALSYAANDVHDYNCWNIVKQKAVEWMRAVDIKKIVTTMKIPGTDQLTTREIVTWCRQNGHTPHPSHKGIQLYSKHCGKQTTNCSISPRVSSVYNNVMTASNDIELQQEFDNLLLPAISYNSVTKYRIPRSPELKWVHQTCLKLRILLYPQSHDGMLLHVTDHMIFSATSQFVHQLLMSAVTMETACSSFDWRKERIIVPFMICSAINNILEFDFLTDSGLTFL